MLDTMVINWTALIDQWSNGLYKRIIQIFFSRKEKVKQLKILNLV